MQVSSLPASVLLQIWIAALLTLYPLPSQSFTTRSVSSGVGPAISTVTCNWKSPTASVRRTDHHCRHRHHHHHPRHHRPLWSTANQESNEKPSSSSSSTTMTYSPIFDFASPDQMAVNKFERIDDAIMGGISLSSLKQLSPEENFARWSGICRLDGGGFCGTRTLPFQEPIQVGNETEGLYLLCRLTSDDEPERRVWKVTTRSEQSRGEQLYQAMFEFSKDSVEEGGWTRVEVPFSSFRQVRGPRLVEGAPPLDVSNGLFQIGISLSKFKIAKNVTEVLNFRPGYFELQIKEIGAYTGKKEVSLDLSAPSTLSKQEAEKKKPLALKIILPVAKLFFSEKRRRRDSAMRILRKRGFSRTQAMLFGFKLRAKQDGFLVAAAKSMGVLCQDMARLSLYWTLRLTLVMPVLLLSRLMRFVVEKFRANPSKSKDAAD